MVVGALQRRRVVVVERCGSSRRAVVRREDDGHAGLFSCDVKFCRLGVGELLSPECQPGGELREPGHLHCKLCSSAPCCRGAALTADVVHHRNHRLRQRNIRKHVISEPSRLPLSLPSASQPVRIRVSCRALVLPEETDPSRGRCGLRVEELKTPT